MTWNWMMRTMIKSANIETHGSESSNITRPGFCHSWEYQCAWSIHGWWNKSGRNSLSFYLPRLLQCIAYLDDFCNVSDTSRVFAMNNAPPGFLRCIVLFTSRIASNWGRHCSRFLRPMWRNERRSFSLTWGCRSLREESGFIFIFGCFNFTWKQFLIFFKISGFNWDTIDPPVQESFEVPGREQLLEAN